MLRAEGCRSQPVRQLDGAGLRMEAEFKLHRLSWNIVYCLTASALWHVLSLVGLYLDHVEPHRTAETGLAYVREITDIGVSRKRLCEGDAQSGLFGFIVF